MQTKNLSEEGLNFLIKEEGLSLRPYRCAGGVPTIGIGCTFYPDGRKVKLGDPPITREEAIQMLKILLKDFESRVCKSVRQELNQRQFEALVSLCFNIGTSAFASSMVLKRVNVNPNDPAIKQAFEAWKMAAGKPILLGRRVREWRWYNGN
ncbi:MAG: lysozyme [Pedobacter sp.]|nr:MAG: lysozyme [Pedobacter sp.]